MLQRFNDTHHVNLGATDDSFKLKRKKPHALDSARQKAHNPELTQQLWDQIELAKSKSDHFYYTEKCVPRVVKNRQNSEQLFLQTVQAARTR